jgi:hypothetical protein
VHRKDRRRRREERALTAPTMQARNLRLFAGAPLALAVLALLLVAIRPAAAHADDGERAYDGGPQWREAGELAGADLHDLAVPLAIAFFTDCTEAPSLSPPACGSPPAKWVAPDNPVEFCTVQAGRPASVSAGGFREAVAQGAAAWNAVSAAVGVRYLGDCATGATWQQDNGRNEIGFDDTRNAVSGSSAAITLGAWQTSFPAGEPNNVLSRKLVEADIIIDHRISVPDQCFASTITHEIGHAIGFGHSDSSGDLMFPSFNPSNLSTCPTAPSSAEFALLQALYGVDLPPNVDAGPDRSVDFSAQVTLRASATDPEGGSLSIGWEQVSGPSVAIVGLTSGLAPVFTAPAAEATLEFEVTATDAFLHTATDRVVISVSESGGVPAGFPVFSSFLPASFVSGSPPGTAVLGWNPVDGSSSYEICTAPAPTLLANSCATIAAPSVPITWDTVLGAAGSAADTRVLKSGWRLTRIQACSSSGCSRAVDGPIAGGVRWSAWGIDYDFLAMTFDIAGFEFTFAAVLNVSGPARQFELGNGPAGDPFQRQMGRCLGLGPSGACFAFLDFNDGRQDSVVGVRSSRPGTPTVEHHIPVR